MFKLTSKLALSNLKQNRKLYYPFAIAVILTTMILYSFIALATTPHLEDSYGGGAAKTVLGFGSFVVQLVVIILVAYANGYVMKNRSKELGIYGMLGLEKRHLIGMTFKELLIFGLVTVTAGIGIGALFDNLIFALLLKLSKMKVELVATFQWSVVLSILLVFGLIFLVIVFLNAIRIIRMDALQLSREKAKGEKKGRFLVFQTILGLLSLGSGYYLAQSVTNALLAISTFFLAVILVILGTYLLFNAGITVFLKMLKKNKKYYYKPNNLISVSNLIFRMKKNAVGLATIAILSTMVLVTMSAATSIYNGSENIKKLLYPHDMSISGQNVEVEDLDQLLTQYAKEKNLTISTKDVLSYASFGLSSQDGTKLTTFAKGQNSVMPKTVFLVFDQKDYEKMTGQKLNLTNNEVGLFAKNDGLKGQKAFSLNNQNYTIKQEIQQDFLRDHVANQYVLLISDYNYLVVSNLQNFLDRYQDSAIYTQLYGGMDVTASKEEQLKLADDFENYSDNFSHNLKNENGMVYGANIASESTVEMNALFGGVLFIGIFLSIIFMVGTVLVIYYKQISEGYEDRERFVILQKVGLDHKQIKQTINKQVLTVFFLPLAFAFLHLAFAYHMLSLILKVVGVVDSAMMLSVTLSICGIFALVYVLIFMITSRSYRRIVQM